MKTYRVDVTRTTFADMTFNVEAKNEVEAEQIALTIANDALWGNGNVEYEVDYMEEIDEEDETD